MSVTVLSSPSVELPVGGLWLISVAVTEPVLPAVAPTVTVTLPDASTATPTVVTVGGGYVYYAEVITAAAGRYTARVTTVGDGAADFVAYVTAVTANSAMPALEDLRGVDPDREDLDDLGYLGANSWTDDEIQDALDAEAAAQRRVCRVPAAYPADLRQALLRRVAVNLARRGLPLSMLQGDAEGGGTAPLPANDAEVRRLERAHRKLFMA